MSLEYRALYNIARQSATTVGEKFFELKILPKAIDLAFDELIQNGNIIAFSDDRKNMTISFPGYRDKFFPKTVIGITATDRASRVSKEFTKEIVRLQESDIPVAYREFGPQWRSEMQLLTKGALIDQLAIALKQIRNTKK